MTNEQRRLLCLERQAVQRVLDGKEFADVDAWAQAPSGWALACTQRYLAGRLLLQLTKTRRRVPYKEWLRRIIEAKKGALARSREETDDLITKLYKERRQMMEVIRQQADELDARRTAMRVVDEARDFSETLE